MNEVDDIKKIANKMHEIYIESPNDYYYLKGFIERIAQENKTKKLKKNSKLIKEVS